MQSAKDFVLKRHPDSKLKHNKEYKFCVMSNGVYLSMYGKTEDEAWNKAKTHVVVDISKKILEAIKKNLQKRGYNFKLTLHGAGSTAFIRKDNDDITISFNAYQLVQFSLSKIVAVVFHELGHYKKGHLEQAGWSAQKEYEAQMWAFNMAKRVSDKRVVRSLVSITKGWTKYKLNSDNKRYRIAADRILKECVV